VVKEHPLMCNSLGRTILSVVPPSWVMKLVGRASRSELYVQFSKPTSMNGEIIYS